MNCQRKPLKRHRTTLSITIDPHVLEALKKWMAREGETKLVLANGLQPKDPEGSNRGGQPNPPGFCRRSK
jgi:hypothetical protein